MQQALKRSLRERAPGIYFLELGLRRFVRTRGGKEDVEEEEEKGGGEGRGGGDRGARINVQYLL